MADLGDIDILDLEVVQNVGQTLKSDELASADILLALHKMSTTTYYGETPQDIPRRCS